MSDDRDDRDDRWERHEQLASALADAPDRAGALAQELGLDPNEAGDVALALAALGAATAFDEPNLTLGSTLDAGERIGDYEILERVGRGGFGVVYRARDPVLDVDVALKLIAVAPGAREEVQERFEQEARAVARLDHPNIVRVRTAGWDPRGPFLVMDFVPGESLHERLVRDGPLPVSDAVKIARQLAEALDHAHGEGVLHRDVKADNVLVTEDGVARLTDFGLARDALAQGDSKVSRAGHALGTPGYWPPEQARGDLEAIGPPSDVYGLGATLYALLTGRPPYTGPHTLAILEAMARRAEVPPPSASRDDVDPYLDAVCARCLEHDPRRRYASARALADALAAWGTGAGRVPSRSAWARGGIVAAAVLLAAGAMVFVGKVPSSEAVSATGADAPVAVDTGSEAAVDTASAAAVDSGSAAALDSGSAQPPAQRWVQPAWRPLQAAEAPEARGDATLVSDPLTGGALLFGGAVRKAATADLWSWNGERWSPLAAGGPGPSARTGSAGVFDTRRKHLLIFGGRSDDGWEDDMWAWDGAEWSQGRLPEGARSTAKPVAAYDARRGISVVLLGREVWEWSAGWSLKPTPPVQGRVLLWNAERERIQLFGQDGRLWGYDGTAWRGATAPLPRKKLRFMWAVATDDGAVLALVGPKPPRKRLAQLETWLFEHESWRQLDAGSPAMQVMAGMAWVPRREQVVILGGPRKRRARAVTWALSARGR